MRILTLLQGFAPGGGERAALRCPSIWANGPSSDSRQGHVVHALTACFAGRARAPFSTATLVIFS